ncbi:hypothetical protein TVD_09265 [Thioalkalivibrio versutus]|uniref:Lipoprotein n=1 Tax=Thioalkalivibrio versutus TaxID=106634 RepID=A0A0G3G7R1_9GAMM|nr:hypothetical protein [Thioalkalivibrio versutus]AKJ95532.1 hypothetical protein TVD_09265 [Thioalkalivibrio versutus]
MSRIARSFLPAVLLAAAGLVAGCMSGGGPEPEFAEGQPFPERTLNDQHGDAVELPGNARVILKTVEAAPAGIANAVLSGMTAEEREGIVYIADIHEMPPQPMQNVVLPRMQARDYSIVVTSSKADAGFLPHQREQVTVILLDDEGVVTGVSHAGSEEALQEMLDNARD